MKQILPSLVAALLGGIVPVHAMLIVYGTLSGVVTQSSGPGPGIRTAVGMPVSGTFSYDYDLLSAPDSSGIRTVSDYDPNSSFIVSSSVGEGGGYRGSIDGDGSLLRMTVDANGLPYAGVGLNAWDVSIGPSSVGLSENPVSYWSADVTYTITGVSDTGATWFLLFLGLAGLAVGRRFKCRMKNGE